MSNLSDTQIDTLKQLLLAYWAAPEDTQDEDDAFNTLCDNIEAALITEERQDAWHASNLKATQDEIILNGLDMLDLQQMQQEAWEEFKYQEPK